MGFDELVKILLSVVNSFQSDIIKISSLPSIVLHGLEGEVLATNRHGCGYGKWMLQNSEKCFKNRLPTFDKDLESI